MAISKDKRDHIITHYTDHTIRELANMHSVSTSTVQRVIAQAKSQQESMKDDANASSNTNTDTNTQAQVVPSDTDSAPAGNNNDHFQYVPDSSFLKFYQQYIINYNKLNPLGTMI